jgi:signal transduction histidine kinase/HAMP domain-containing protein
MSTRRRLSRLLLASHMGLVLLFAVLLLALGVGSIQSAVEGQARTEAERAAAEARKRVEEWRRELDVRAGLLVEQPTLSFYLRRGQMTKMRALVRDFHATSGMDYIQVNLRGHTVAEFGTAPPQLYSGFQFQRGGGWRVQQRPLPHVPDAYVVVGSRLGDRLDVRPTTPLVNARMDPPPREDKPEPRSWPAALARVARTGEPETFTSLRGIAAARILPLREGPGAPIALVSATVAPEWVERRIFEWLAGFAVAALATFGLALALAFFLARRIARPFAQVASSADRLGRGDLATPIARPDTFLTEPNALATSLESMRQQVGALTATERSQREELDAVLDGVDEGIAGVDLQDVIHYANRQFLALAERTREAVLGQPLDAVLEALGDPGESVDGAASIDVAPQRFRARGGQRPLTLRRLAASGNRQVLILREENAIEAARAMRDRILANLSHEFQTPLSAQIASIELLRDHLRETRDPVASHLADAQYRGTMRLAQLVENLLDSVRIESGEMRLRKQPVDLAEVVADAVELMQPLVDQRDQRVVATLVPGPSLIGDPQRLFSVMVNLLANANKFAPDQTQIWVDMAWTPGHVTVSVEDEGPGLPAGPQGIDLFAPFRRSPDEEPSQRGTGLGLAIVHAIVRAHGGEVRVEAPRQRHGARIAFVLPVE